MANLLTQNPIKIYNIQSSYKTAVASSLGTLFTLRIEKVYWFNPINAGDQFVIVDPANGNNLLVGRCEASDQSQIFDWSTNPKPWSDFAVVQLDSGYLEIYTR